MEALTRLVSESLARYGLDRPVDYRRLQWSRWFRCESPHSLLLVPSKPGVFALAEEIMEFGIGAHFASSLELNVAREDRVAAGDSPANAGGSAQSQRAELGLNSAPGSPGPTQTPLPLDPGAATNIRCPQPLPSGF